ncbi:hypothetical protein SAMN05444320_1086 [Streptoalloteichus hindustanus]|uniref:Uncharacterized protein n=1 Tax=Streptoalloteichus hindustanus TaxID=2017 RepID=A0A1M5IU38_STRHI|nr:hypothetical protein SAMN05444320_1086 [Streptoalloteichus hindustanus]
MGPATPLCAACVRGLSYEWGFREDPLGTPRRRGRFLCSSISRRGRRYRCADSVQKSVTLLCDTWSCCPSEGSRDSPRTARRSRARRCWERLLWRDEIVEERRKRSVSTGKGATSTAGVGGGALSSCAGHGVDGPPEGGGAGAPGERRTWSHSVRHVRGRQAGRWAWEGAGGAPAVVAVVGDGLPVVDAADRSGGDVLAVGPSVHSAPFRRGRGAVGEVAPVVRRRTGGWADRWGQPTPARVWPLPVRVRQLGRGGRY